MSATGASGGAPALFSLLRTILRLHRERLPPPMHSMGDTYVKSEFRRHLKAQTTEEQWRTFAVEWQRYAAMLGGTADQQLASVAAAATEPPAAAAGGGCGGGDAAAKDQAAVPADAKLASVTAAIASGHRDMTEQLLEQLNPDQRRQLIKLQQEALALGAEMLGKSELAAQLGQALQPPGSKDQK